MDDLRSAWFFLVYFGKGYSLDDVRSMTLPELRDHTNRLYNQLQEEKEAREEQERQQKAKSQRKRKPPRPPRRR